MWVRINFCRKPLQADYKDSQLDDLAFLCRILCLQMCACLARSRSVKSTHGQVNKCDDDDKISITEKKTMCTLQIH